MSDLLASPEFSWLGAGLGATLALGGWLVWVRLPARRRPELADRLAPYVRDAAPPSALLTSSTPQRSHLDLLAWLISPITADAVRWLDRILGGASTVRRRLDQLGSPLSLEGFRAQQVLWGAAGLFVGLALAFFVGVHRGFAAVPLLGLVLICGVVGVLGRDQLLAHQVRAREQRILTEFPTVAELLALSVSAGEGAVGALERVARSTSGELSGELRRTLADARAGASLVDALESMATRTSLPILSRFVDGVAVALERGTPLADVLRAQAADVREASRRQLLETGGKKEIAMMAPVVFLVLPITVVFAIYPGVMMLGTGGP